MTFKMHSEYMEAFFGVELYKKLQDTIGDLENIEIDLKDISKEVARLGGNIETEDRVETAREMRAAIYESGQQVKDVRTFLDFYFTNGDDKSQIILERDAYMLLYQIYHWDFNDVRDLRSWIRDFKEVCDKIGYRADDLLKLDHLNLTAVPVPEDVKEYPVYAIDKHDYCLCGDDCEEIIHVDEVREALEERKN